MKNFKRALHCLLGAAVLLCPQQPSPFSANAANKQSPTDSEKFTQQTRPVLQSPAGTPGATSEDPAPLYGLQGVLVETLDGKTIASQAADDPLNPASALKLATALVALRTLGPQHRFTIQVWTDGELNRATGQIEGNIYVSGADPSLHYEHVIEIASGLNRLGIRTVSGDLVVRPGFTLNFISSASRSAEQFYNTLDFQLRSAAATRAWLNSPAALSNASPPTVAVLGNISVGDVAPQARLLLTHSSSALADILKVLLCYSNNFMTERIGQNIGGAPSVRRYLIDVLGVKPDQIRLASLSGLGTNRLTPRAMMKILRQLNNELERRGLWLSDVMPVAGVDPGTLEDRFATLPWRGSVIAKTGTLARTDRGVSSLVGQMRTASGEKLFFVIMNQKGNVSRFRENQDNLVMQILSTLGGPKPFDYRALPVTLKLADTRNSFANTDQERHVVITGGSSP